MPPESIFPNLSVLNRHDSPSSSEELLTRLSLLALAVQAQLATAPRFAAEYQAGSNEQALLDAEQVELRMPGWKAEIEAWWAEQLIGGPLSPTLRGQLYQLLELEIAQHALGAPEARRVIETLLGTGEAAGDFGQVLLSVGGIRVPLPGSFVVAGDVDDFVDGEDFLLYGPAWGVWLQTQREEAAERLRHTLLEALGQGKGWVRFLPANLLLALEGGQALSLTFQSFDGGFSAQQIQDVRVLQDHLMADLQARAAAGPVLASQFNAVVRLDAWMPGWWKSSRVRPPTWRPGGKPTCQCGARACKVTRWPPTRRWNRR